MLQRLICVVFALVLISTAVSFAGSVPEAMNYQGLMKNTEGAITEPTQITFKIYDAAIGGTSVWVETVTVDPDDAGQFSQILGKINPLTHAVLNGEPRWLGLTVGTDSEAEPRTELVSSSYSFRVSTIDQAEGGTIKGPLVMEESNTRGLAPSILLAGIEGDTVQICVSACALFRATNVGGAEVVNLSVSSFDNSASFVITGPGGDDQAIFASTGTELFVESGRGLSKTIALSAHEGLVVLSRTNESDTIVHIIQHETSGLPSIELRDPATNNKTVFNTGEDAVAVYDQNDNLQITFGLSPDGGGATTLWDGTSKSKALSNKVMSMTKEGLKVFDETGLTEIAQVTKDGDYFATGMIAVGEGCAGDGDWSVVFGFNNTASGDSSTISGGYNNTAGARLSTVGGGTNNIVTASGDYSIISGGANNKVDSGMSVISGGIDNYASGLYATVAGGSKDSAYGWASTVGGGDLNVVSAVAGTIAGGHKNRVNGAYGSVLGGYSNEASAMSGILGGRDNYIDTSAGYSAILSGDSCRILAEHSVVAGWRAIAKHRNCFVWSGLTRGDASDSVWTSSAEQVVLAAGGGIYLTNSPGEAVYDGTKLITTSTGASLTTGGVWTDAPKSIGKSVPVDGIKVLGMLDELPVGEWSSAEDGTRHISPLPNDFHAITGLGSDDGSISSGDMAGVALVAVKQLYKMVQQQQQLALELKDKDEQIESLEMRLTQMEAMMEIILAQRDGSNNDNKTLASNR